MLQVRKSRSCGFSVFFFQCCFMIETQVLMTVSSFSGFFCGNHFLKGGFTFQRGKGRGRRGFEKNCRMEGATPMPLSSPHHHHYGKTWCLAKFSFTPCSSVSIVNYAHVTASWKGLRILKTCKPCHVWAGAPSYLLLLLLLLLTLFTVGKNSIGYLELLDQLQKRICRTVGPSLLPLLNPWLIVEM